MLRGVHLRDTLFFLALGGIGGPVMVIIEGARPTEALIAVPFGLFAGFAAGVLMWGETQAALEEPTGERGPKRPVATRRTASTTSGHGIMTRAGGGS